MTIVKNAAAKWLKPGYARKAKQPKPVPATGQVVTPATGGYVGQSQWPDEMDRQFIVNFAKKLKTLK